MYQRLLQALKEAVTAGYDHGMAAVDQKPRYVSHDHSHLASKQHAADKPGPISSGAMPSLATA